MLLVIYVFSNFGLILFVDFVNYNLFVLLFIYFYF
jgi:hypothetical protein